MVSTAVGQTTPTPRIEERNLPKTILLPVKDGVITEGAPLETVIDFPAEAFQKWYQEFYRPSVPRELPKYAFDGVRAEITVEGNNARIHVTYEIVPSVSGWIQVPLGLRDAVPRSQPVIRPEIDFKLDRPADNNTHDGYSLWCHIPEEEGAPLSPLKQESITIEASAVIPLTDRGDEWSLETNLPADTKCQVEIDIPQAGAKFSQQGNMVFKSLTEPPPPEHSVQLLEFAGGPLNLNWRFDEQSSIEQAVQLQVIGELRATAEQEDRVTTVASLEVSSKTIPFDSFDIQIDDNADYIPPTMPASNYKVQQIENQGQRFGNRLHVELSEPTKGPVIVSVTTRQTEPVPGDRGKRQFTLGRFDVVGSEFQSGDLTIAAANDVHVMWDTPQSMRERTIRSGEIPNVRASYDYDHQPAFLVINTQPIQSTARVKSEYELSVGTLDSELVGKFTYRLPRTYHDDLVIDLNGWNVTRTRVDPPDAAQWQPPEGDSDQLILPLSPVTSGEAIANAPYRTITIEMRARRDHAQRDPEAIQLPWPMPRAEPWGTDMVMVIPSDDVDIRYQSEKSTGFQLDRSQSQAVELTGKRGTIVLRAAPAQDNLQLGLALSPIVPRLIISNKARVQLQAGNQQSLVTQQFRLETFHSVPEKAIFDLPMGIDTSEVLQAKVNDVEVAGRLIDQMNGRMMEYPLGEADPPYRIELSYTSPIETMNADRSQYQLYLMTPQTSELSAAQIDVDFKPLELTFDAPEEVDVLSPTQKWQPFATALLPNTVHIPGDQCQLVEFSAPFLVPKTDDRVVVDFHWLQVALTPDERRDRAVFTLRTSAPKLTITLPQGVSDTEVYWNGSETEYAQVDNKITFEVSEHSDTGEDLLDVWYRYPLGTGIQSSMQVESPEIENAIIGSGHPGKDGGYSYLQIVSPGNWMVLSAAQMSEEMDWVWQNGRYRRTPRLDQSQLEQLAGIKATSEFPRGMDRALYSTIGPIRGVYITSAKLSHLMLLFSGISLGTLLLLFYVPQSRNTLVFGAAAIGMISLAVVYPDFAVLIGQMSAIGIMLAIVGIALYHMLSSRAPVRSAVRARSSSDSQASVPVQSTSNSAGHSAVSTTSLPATIPSSGQSR
ncbi:hypothetical protein [Blastopirellula marina]|uniref:hypothetical protein n=1 Tax=Blastopirellula marina TaxID=124 RepID=UPI0011B01068|nr:hypothetical protein [Blastopirellula marina]